jgi:hypothetical protein
MQLLIDRRRPFIASGGLRGKQAVLVAPSEDGEVADRPEELAKAAALGASLRMA